MREWDGLADAVAAAGARVVVLTPDAPDVAAAAVKEKGFTTPLLPVDASLWVGWGLRNPKKPKVPHPGTLLVAPDGTLVARWTHINFKQREDPAVVLAQIAEHRDSGEIAGGQAPAPTTGDGAPDWAGAVTISTERTGDGALLVLQLKDGFHVYGSKEPNARPLEVRVTDQPEAKATIPNGNRKSLGDLGESWVLEGMVALKVSAPDIEGPLSGELDIQLCTDGACSMPETRSWTAE